MKPSKLFKEKDVAVLESDGNYTHVTFTDNSKAYVSYCQKEIIRRFGVTVPLKKVNHKVAVDASLCSVEGGKVKYRDSYFTISRRKMSNWAAVLLALVSLTATAQNVAPVAVNDTLKVCNDIPSYFSVLANDYDSNNDRLKLSQYSRPTTGDLVAASNTGSFRYDWAEGITSETFSYHLKELKFGGAGSLESNLAYVVMESAAPYYYTGAYTGTNNRLTCRSENGGAATISTTAREVNEAYTYILIDAEYGTVTIEPDSSGVIEFKIK